MVKKQGFIMKIKNGTGILLIVVTALHGADVPQKPIMKPDAETGAQIPPDNYYSSANLARLTTKGEKKHAPLAILIDQGPFYIETPDNKDHRSLTENFAHMLQTAFVPIIVSRSIVYNYFVLRDRSDFTKNDNSFTPQNNPVSFNKWHLYDVPDSQFFLFVPDHYLTYYKDSLGLNLNGLTDLSAKLPTAGDYKTIIGYIKGYNEAPPFSINDLRTILTTIKKTASIPGSEQLTKAELKSQDQLPIWDIILHGHGGPDEGPIGGLYASQIESLLDFFDKELPVGLLYILSCNAGGKNLNLLEFSESISVGKLLKLVWLQAKGVFKGNIPKQENILRILDYILIVAAITDKPIWFFGGGGQSDKLVYQLYNDAARLQDKGKSLDTLLNNLNCLSRHSGSLHASSNIPQVWLPGGLGFQTYQINKKVQIIGKVKVSVHEDEKRPIVLPDSTIVALIYAKSINVPILVTPYVIKVEDADLFDELTLRDKWIKNIPTITEQLTYDEYIIEKKLEKKAGQYPALTHIFSKPDNPLEQATLKKGLKLLYPEFISMLRGSTEQYFSKVELRDPEGEEGKLTGVMHFIRDALFDIGERASTKRFLIKELIGNNDISVLLELSRLKNDIADPHSLELKLVDSIGKHIRLQDVTIETSKDSAMLQFVFDNTAWQFNFDPTFEQVISFFWNLQALDDLQDYASYFNDRIEAIRPEKIDQKSISEILIKILS